VLLVVATFVLVCELTYLWGRPRVSRPDGHDGTRAGALRRRSGARATVT